MCIDLTSVLKNEEEGRGLGILGMKAEGLSS